MYKYLFGPVPSRRLGMSLGVDLVPFKICTLDCVYCECGLTTKLTTERREYVKYELIINELNQYFALSPRPDYITLTGAGEPTLNTRIGDIIDYCKQNFPSRVAVLTNGTLLYDPQLQKQLSNADVVLPSFDAATLEAFNKINKPHKTIDLQIYLEGLIQFRKNYKGQIWLEILILPGYNDDQKNIAQLRDAISKINPNKVQLNTLDRPGAIEGLKPASLAQLQNIVQLWQLPNVEIVSRQYSRSDITNYRKDIEEAIIETIQRRPCTITDLEQFLGLQPDELNRYLSFLTNENKIKTELLNNQYYYKINQL